MCNKPVSVGMVPLKARLPDRRCCYRIERGLQDIINFEESVFEINYDWVTRATKGELITFSDYDNYDKVRKEHRGPEFLLANKLVLDFSKQKHDLIRLLNMPMTGSGYYVSERLKSAIEERKFTGFAFKEIEEMSKWIQCVF